MRIVVIRIDHPPRFPITNALSGTSFDSMLPLAIVTLLPIVIAPAMTEPVPTQTLSPILLGDPIFPD
jgi:hypothetical protein